MGVNKAIALVGLALQPARGSVQAQPTIAHGVTGGSVIKSDIKIESDPVTSGQRFSTSADVASVENGAEFECRAYFKAIGYYFYGVMGRVDTHAGVSTFGVANKLPYWTFWGMLDDQIVRIDDSKISELTIKWEGNKPLEVSVVLMGCELTPDDPDGERITMVPVETEGGEDRFTPVGGSFKVSVDGAAAEAPIIGGEIKFINKADRTVLSGSLEAVDVDEANFEAEVSITVKPDDLALWRKAYGGTKKDGAFELGFGVGEATLTISGDKVPFVVPFPEADPGGGSAELELNGLAQGTVDGTSPITAVLDNGVESYDGSTS